MEDSQALAVVPNGKSTALVHGTTTAHSSAAMAKAEVEARFAVAVGRPRNIDESRATLLPATASACSSPTWPGTRSRREHEGSRVRRSVSSKPPFARSATWTFGRPRFRGRHEAGSCA